jgi:hypothetical protein
MRSEFEKSKDPTKLNILNDLMKNDERLSTKWNKNSYISMDLRYAIDLEESEYTINIKPKNFRYKLDDHNWKSVRIDNKLVMNYILNHIQEDIKTGWKTQKNMEECNISKQDKSIKVEVNV